MQRTCTNYGWKRDWGLTTRVWLTGLLLLLLYLVFMTILFVLFPSASIWLFVILAVGMGLVQYFFSDKMVLWSTGARVIEEDEYPELHLMVEKLSKEAGLPLPKIAIMPESRSKRVCNRQEPKACGSCLHGFHYASPDPRRTRSSSCP